MSFTLLYPNQTKIISYEKYHVFIYPYMNELYHLFFVKKYIKIFKLN